MNNFTGPGWANRLARKLIEKVAEKYSLNPDLLAALIQTESSGNSLAQRFEPGWSYFVKVPENAKRLQISATVEKRLQATSLGLCQVMGSVARELGMKEHLRDLMIPQIGIEYGAKKLSQCMLTYRGDWIHALAAYNGGSARVDEHGHLESRLQTYADKVMGYFDQLGPKAKNPSNLSA